MAIPLFSRAAQRGKKARGVSDRRRVRSEKYFLVASCRCVALLCEQVNRRKCELAMYGEARIHARGTVCIVQRMSYPAT